MKIPTTVVSLLAMAYSATANDCSEGEVKLEFTLYLDEDSHNENGWSLACEDVGTVWTIPVGSIQFTDPTATGYVHRDSDPAYVKDQVCLSVDSTCHFTLEDTYGDGLVFPGYFFLTYGPKTIAVSEMEEEFFEKGYCVGPNCMLLPEETTQDCDYVYVFAQADLSPEQNTINIECNQEIVFQKTFSVPEETAEFDECIPTTMCCTLTITDSAGDGLNVVEGAQLHAEWASTVLVKYDTSDNAFEFQTASFDFGLGCGVPEPEAGQPDDTPSGSVDQSNDKLSKDGPRAGIAFAIIGAILLLCLIVFVVFVRRNSRTGHDGRSSTRNGKDADGKDLEVRSEATDMDAEPVE
jgi:hypothetical protein